MTKNDQSKEIHEVKGWYDDRSKRKLHLMREQFTDKPIILIKWRTYRLIELKFGDKIPGWEFAKRPKGATVRKASEKEIAYEEFEVEQQKEEN